MVGRLIIRIMIVVIFSDGVARELRGGTMRRAYLTSGRLRHTNWERTNIGVSL